MSPVAINFFRSIPTSLELDGPTISFIQHPSDGSENFAGLVTFTGICTARFPALSTESANGTFTFKWYLGDTQVEDTADDADSNARIVSVGIDTNVSIGGTTYERIGISTLTLTALDYTNNGKLVHLTGDYIPVSYTGIISGGVYRDGEGNAFNDPLKSNDAVLTTYPEIVITEQPTSETVGAGAEALFNISAYVVPDNGLPLEYQWQLNYEDLTDGTDVVVGDAVTGGAEAKITVTEIAQNNKAWWDAGGQYLDNETSFIDFDKVNSWNYSAYGQSGFGMKDVNAAVSQGYNNCEIKALSDRAISLGLNRGWRARRYIDNLVCIPGGTAGSTSGGTFVLDWDTLTTYSGFRSLKTYKLVSDKDFICKIYGVGGGGGKSKERRVPGQSGGSAQGTFTFLKDQTYYLKVGGGGGPGDGGAPGYPNGGRGGKGHGKGGFGGGMTAFWAASEETAITAENAILVAGGGGGGANDPDYGGQGGGASYADSSRTETGGYFVPSNGNGNGAANVPERGGAGGTQTAGGQGGQCHVSADINDRGTDGSAFIGGDGSAGGGGGYYGGGGGCSVNGTCCADGGGGGGSGYINTDLVTDPSWSRENTATPQYNYMSDGSFKIDRIGTVNNLTATISGSKTAALSITTSDINIGGPIRCKVSNSGAQEPIVYSDTVAYDIVRARNILNFQAITADDVFTEKEVELTDISSFTLDADTFGSDYKIIQFHAPESSFEVSMQLKASAGYYLNPGHLISGEGGVSDIKFTIQQNVEYTILGISDNSAIFLYKNSTLIAVVGQGGEGHQGSRGGAGGGVNVAGAAAGGQSGSAFGGMGGEKIESGKLTLNGIYGSKLKNATIALDAGDSIATGQDGGRTISCSKGSYWVDKGVGACENNNIDGDTTIQFVNVSGTTIEESANITRGFKPGYTITATGGMGEQGAGVAQDAPHPANGGNGGNGATGGDGGVQQRGGGGGSGYTDGSVTIVNTQLGGNKLQKSSITFSVPSGSDIVKWNVTRNTENTLISIYKKRSGIGPDEITFGPNTSQLLTNVGRGAVYELRGSGTPDAGEETGTWRNSKSFRSDQYRLFGDLNTVGLCGIPGTGQGGTDNQYKDLLISPDKGSFTSEIRWEFTGLDLNTFYRDAEGRLLILSNYTQTADPSTFTKTTAKVNPDTDACIDDTRWQTIIKLAETQNWRLTATLSTNTNKLVTATENNILKMTQANVLTLRSSLTDWWDSKVHPETGVTDSLYALAWDEDDTSGGIGVGGDFSILGWTPKEGKGWSYYADSSNAFFESTVTNAATASWWVLPPGASDFS